MKKNSFYFIRHGETDWNRENRIMGQKDIPLNENGRFQARQAAVILKNYNISTVCHSPLKRAKETAHILSEILNCQLIEIDFLKECGWGIFEGSLKENKHYLEQWKNGVTPEGSESCEDFKERAIEGIKLSLRHSSPLIVSHGGIFWALQQVLCKNKYLNSALNCLPFHFSQLENKDWITTPLDESFDEERFET